MSCCLFATDVPLSDWLQYSFIFQFNCSDVEEQHQLLGLRPLHRLACLPAHPSLQHLHRGALHSRCALCLFPHLQVRDALFWEHLRNLRAQYLQEYPKTFRARYLQDQRLGAALSTAVIQRRKKHNLVRFCKTRPKPAYGRQGLDSDRWARIQFSQKHETTLKNQGNQPKTMKLP